MTIGAALFATGIAAAVAALGEAQPGRTLEELKAETQARADRNAYPLIGLRPDEVREALARLTSLDRDEWAASWSEIGERYMAKKDFRQAWLYYSFARWPVPNSRGKQRAYAICACRKARARRRSSSRSRGSTAARRRWSSAFHRSSSAASACSRSILRARGSRA